MDETKKRKSLLLKILVPVLILLAIGGVWIMKNTGDATPTPEIAYPDFALDAGEDFDLERLTSYGLPVLLDFSADWCQPCQQMKPILTSLNTELQGRAIVVVVNTEKYPEVTAQFPVRAIPTQFFFDADGTPYTPEDPDSMGLILYSHRDTEEHLLTAHEGFWDKESLLAALKEMGMEE